MDFDDTSYEQIQSWIERGKPQGMPDHLVTYLQLLELVRGMYDKYQAKKFIIKTLSLPPWNLSEFRANRIYGDSLNFFYASNDVKREAWAQIYADKLDNLARIAIAADDLQTAHKCMLDAVKLRMGKEAVQTIPKELLDRRVIIYTMEPRDVGLNKPNRLKLAQFIDGLEDISFEEKTRLHRDGLTNQADGNVFDTDISDIDFANGK